MSEKTIIVRESYDWITNQDVTSGQFAELIRYIEEKYPNSLILEQKYQKFRFINFVGVIQCSNVRYEILPKIDLSLDDERKALVSMLTAANFLPISFYEKVKNGVGKSDLLTAFLTAFIERLLKELNKGLYKTYETKTENLNVLKGRLEFPRHVRTNAFQKTKAYCSYDEHTENNLLNQLFKVALLIVRKNINLPQLKLAYERCLGYLENVDLLYFDSFMLNKLVFNRHNNRFRDVALFAKLIIEHASIYNRGKSSTAFSFLFPMNVLFEKYIEAALKVAVGYDKVISQHDKQYLLRNKKTGKRSVLMKPDFLIGETTILDTKWKSATYNGRYNYNQADVYQMYAYVTSYKNAKRCILLYPKQGEEVDFPLWEVIGTDKTIEMQTIRIDDFYKTVEELRRILL